MWGEHRVQGLGFEEGLKVWREHRELEEHDDGHLDYLDDLLAVCQVIKIGGHRVQKVGQLLDVRVVLGVDSCNINGISVAGQQRLLLALCLVVRCRNLLLLWPRETERLSHLMMVEFKI